MYPLDGARDALHPPQAVIDVLPREALPGLRLDKLGEDGPLHRQFGHDVERVIDRHGSLDLLPQALLECSSVEAVLEGRRLGAAW